MPSPRGRELPHHTLSGVVAAEGGIPLLVNGKIVGAIGVSGMTSVQDNQCAKAGADSLK